jgi:hypothetical protein
MQQETMFPLTRSPIGSAAEKPLSVVVTGYSKSGNTWLSNLGADVLRCPMLGFWGSGTGRYEPDGRPPIRASR